jgi:hypothetical protein
MSRDRTPSHAFEAFTPRVTLASGLRGLRPVLAGHLGHARLADRVIYRLRRSSPPWLDQNDPQIRVLTKYPA